MSVGRAWYKEHGICPQCGQRDGFNGGVLCFMCREKNQQKNIKYQSDPDRRSQYNKTASKRKKRRIGDGKTNPRDEFCKHCGAKIIKE